MCVFEAETTDDPKRPARADTSSISQYQAVVPPSSDCNGPHHWTAGCSASLNPVFQRNSRVYCFIDMDAAVQLPSTQSLLDSFKPQSNVVRFSKSYLNAVF
jgi:hypothetical protein